MESTDYLLTEANKLLRQPRKKSQLKFYFDAHKLLEPKYSSPSTSPDPPSLQSGSLKRSSNDTAASSRSRKCQKSSSHYPASSSIQQVRKTTKDTSAATILFSPPIDQSVLDGFDTGIRPNPAMPSGQYPLRRTPQRTSRDRVSLTTKSDGALALDEIRKTLVDASRCLRRHITSIDQLHRAGVDKGIRRKIRPEAMRLQAHVDACLSLCV
ncbi:MAG: hypothetical protein M1828_001039 [Chrysothrix sp. TS-e1954]|nr:MAG: hypothetical protein M1828_001039 [Chrysothrix sp. TS-e1954]